MKPPGSETLQTATEIIAKAHKNLAPPVWDYVAGAAESETSKRRNRDSIEDWAFRPRVLCNTASVNASTTLLGIPLRIPVLLAPIGSLQTVVAGGALESVQAAADFGTLPIISSVTEPTLEETARSSDIDKWFQLYIRGDFDWIAGMIDRIQNAGYHALVLTVDAAWYSIRERQILNQWQPPSLSKGPTGLEYQALLDWGLVERIRDRTDLPLVIKGIQTVEDAEIAHQIGADVVYLSNHGGRQADHVRGGMHILVEVVQRLGGQIPIVIDGGFLRGTDVIKAIALGANAVAIGRLQAYALAAGATRMLVRLLEILENEMRTGMAMMGLTSIGQIDRNLLDSLGPPSGGGNPFPLLPEHIRY
jgi:isopentenyl diphosphate isomerase/L-lactate dehydrogenase-like FMN-dependent dehydrogenase